MEEQPAASGVGSSVDPDHMSIDDFKTSDPKVDSDSQSCRHCGTRLDLGQVEYAPEVTENMVSDQIWSHEKEPESLLKELRDLMPEKDFKNAWHVVVSSRNQTPAERNSLYELLLYMKTILGSPDEVRKITTSSSTSSSSSLYLYIVKVCTVVTGRTCGADEEILERAKKVGRLSTTHVETTADLQDCDIIILFCPIASRVGTDVDAAMKHVPGDKKVILVLMHHTRKNDYSVDEKKRWSDDFNNIVLYVHVLFHETLPGLLKCKRNEEAVKQIRDEIKKHSKNRLY